MSGIFQGMTRVTITSADTAALLTELMENGITITKIKDQGLLQIEAAVLRRDLPAVMDICEKRGESCRIGTNAGLYWKLQSILKRPVLIVGIMLLFVLSIYLPSRVLFIRVEGNQLVPERLILECASECGIRFWASRAEVRSEKMKNALMEKLPQLQWAGVNTAGCVATISVTERTEEEITSSCQGLCHLVAYRDGIVTSATATSGSLLCKTGQAVNEGQVLISGYTDCGGFIRAECAQGEVYGQTKHQIQAVLPVEILKSDENTVAQKKYSLQIGKNRINFYKGSGILDSSCVKMYVYHYLSLPGGFQLPVVLIEEQWISVELVPAQRVEDSMLLSLQQCAKVYLMDQMIAGQILEEQKIIHSTNDSCRMTVDYVCLEMIARVRQEENFTQYGEND